MIEEITANIYKVEIPIPDSPLGSLNSYVIRGPGRNLIIDTGLNQKECMDAMQAGLKELGVNLRETDIFITHIHPDHLGLASNLATDTTTIYFNQPEADWIKCGINWDDFINFTRLNGFPGNDLKLALHNYNYRGFELTLKRNIVFHILQEGEIINIENNIFRCVETPGHSKGHLCLYEPNKKIFVAGDHIISDITPGIQLWSDEWDPLAEYLVSLNKVYELDIEVTLPGHRGIFGNCKERIQELKDHHQKRLDEIISILEKGAKDAFQIGSQMSWDIACNSWDLFPPLQKCFAFGEAIAHLKYLERKGEIRKEIEEKRIVYSLNVNP